MKQKIWQLLFVFVIKCKRVICENVKTGEFEVITYKTNTYSFRELPMNTFKISIMADKDVGIALTKEPVLNNPVYEITIDTLENHEWCTIRKNQQEEENVKTKSGGLVDSARYTVFWIEHDGFMLSVGVEGDGCPLITWTDKEKLNFKYVGVRTVNSTGKWIISHDPYTAPEHKIKSDYDDYIKYQIELKSYSKYGYDWMDWISTGLDFSVMSDDVRCEIVLANMAGSGFQLIEPYHRIILGGDKGTDNKSEIFTETKTTLLKNEYASYWIRWVEGKVSMGRKGEKCPFLSWEDIVYNFTVKTVGFGSCSAWWRFSVPAYKDNTSNPHLPSLENPDPLWFGPGHVPIYAEAGGHTYMYYQFFKMTSSCFSFEVRTERHFWLMLLDEPHMDKKKIQITFQDEYVYLNRYDQLQWLVVHLQGLLSSDHFRGFWVCHKNNIVTMGQKNEKPFLIWCNTQPHEVNYFAISGQPKIYLKVNVPAVLVEPDQGVTTTTTELATTRKPRFKEFYTKPGANYQYKKWPNRSCLHFQVVAPNDAYIALRPAASAPSRSHQYEIYLGGWLNKRTTIHKDYSSPLIVAHTDGILSQDEHRSFWVMWDDTIAIGHEGKACPIASWCDPDPIPIETIGIRTNEGAAGYWLLEVQSNATYRAHVNKIPDPLPARPIAATGIATESKYQFLPWDKTIIQFQVKAARDAQITLSTYKNIENIRYEIIIGGLNNNKASIQKTHFPPFPKVEVEASGLLNVKEFKSFWIRWNSIGFIEVGKDDEKCPFISWCDPEPVAINFVGILTKGNIGRWKIHGMTAKLFNKLKIHIPDDDTENDSAVEENGHVDDNTEELSNILRPSTHNTDECPYYDKAYLCIRKCVDFKYDLAYADKNCDCTCFKNKDKEKLCSKAPQNHTFWRLGAPTTRIAPWDITDKKRAETQTKVGDSDQEEETI